MAQTQTPQEKADAALVKFWPFVIEKQDAYLAAHGKYYQGIITPTTVPPLGADRPVDKTKKPHDQNENWNDVFGVMIPDTLPCSVEIHAYQSLAGHSFTLYGWITDTQGTWIRAQGQGPESTTFAWTLRAPSE